MLKEKIIKYESEQQVKNKCNYPYNLMEFRHHSLVYLAGS